jgi:hypothetical protein
MTLLASSYSQHRKPALFGRIKAWFAGRPTRTQRRTTIDLRSAPQNLQRDIGLDRLSFTERRW